MVSFKALEEISTTLHTVLRHFSLAKDSGSLRFVSFKALEEISTASRTVLRPEHVSGAERGASAERSVRNIVGARSGFLSKGRSDRSVSLLFRSNNAHTTSLGHAQIHPEFTCAFNN